MQITQAGELLYCKYLLPFSLHAFITTIIRNCPIAVASESDGKHRVIEDGGYVAWSRGG